MPARRATGNGGKAAGIKRSPRGAGGHGGAREGAGRKRNVLPPEVAKTLGAPPTDKPLKLARWYSAALSEQLWLYLTTSSVSLRQRARPLSSCSTSHRRSDTAMSTCRRLSSPWRSPRRKVSPCLRRARDVRGDDAAGAGLGDLSDAGETDELEQALRSLMPRRWYRYRGGGAGKPLQFRLANGARIMCLSGHKPRSLKRGRVDFALYNEAQNMYRAGWIQLRGAIADTGGLVVLAANPPDAEIGRWIETLHERARGEEEPR